MAQDRSAAMDRRLFFGADRATFTRAVISNAEKQRLLATMPVRFVDGADFRRIATSNAEAEKLVREVALKAFAESRVASDPKVKGPLAEGYGAAALVRSRDLLGRERTRIVKDANINFRNDIKICAEQNLLDRIIKLPGVRQSRESRIVLLANVLHSFEDPRYLNRHITPCNSCLDTFQSAMLTRREPLAPDTLVASVAALERDGRTEYQLEIRPLRALLPKMGTLGPSFTTQPARLLPVRYSSAAQSLLKGRNHTTISDQDIRETMQATLAAFAASVQQGRSARNSEYASTGLLLLNDAPGAVPRIATGSNLHVKNSEPLPAELDALANLVDAAPVAGPPSRIDPDWVEKFSRPDPGQGQKDKKSVPPVAQGLALATFVHRQNDYPRPRLLGLLKDAAGGRDFLIGLLRGNAIEVSAASDFLPIQYKDARR